MIACAGSLWATENSISKRCGSRVKITFLLKNPVKGYFPLTPLNSYTDCRININHALLSNLSIPFMDMAKNMQLWLHALHSIEEVYTTHLLSRCYPIENSIGWTMRNQHIGIIRNLIPLFLSASPLGRLKAQLKNSGCHGAP